MFKRVVMIVVVSVGLIPLSGRDARAHLSGYQVINGYLRHVASFDCGMTIKQIPNLDTHPAAIRCEATILEAQVLCFNPQNHDVQPGVAGVSVFVNQRAIEEADITDKKRGRASPFVRFEDDAIGSCRNRNWKVQDVLTTKVQAKIETIECTDDSCTSGNVAYREVVTCALPAQYNLSNPPPSGTDYACALISKEHLD